MHHFYAPYPDQYYDVPPRGSSQAIGSSSNVESPRPTYLDHFTLSGTYPGSVHESTTKTHQWNLSSNDLLHTKPASTEGQGTLKEYDYRSGPGMYLNDQPWPALNNCDMNCNSFHRVTSPYNVHPMSDPVSMTQWIPKNYSTAQLSSTHFTPVVSQPDPIMRQGMPLSDIAVHPVTSHLPRLRYPGNAAYAEQEQEQVQNARTAMPEVNDVVARIGSVLSNGKCVCDVEGCGSQTFARPAELRRHHTTLHTANKPNFWCQIPTCRRSMNGGGEAFHRKDKLASHVRSMHPDVRQVYP